MAELRGFEMKPTSDTEAGESQVNENTNANINNTNNTSNTSKTYNIDEFENIYDNAAFTTDADVEKGLPPSYSVNDLDSEVTPSDPVTSDTCEDALLRWARAHKVALLTLLKAALLMLYFAYFGYSMQYEFGSEGSWRLLVCTVLASAGLLLSHGQNYFRSRRRSDTGSEGGKTCTTFMTFAGRIKLATVLPILLLLGFVVFVVLDVGVDSPRNLVSFAGMAFFLLAGWLLSYSRKHIKWRPVLWGLTLEATFALLVIRTSWGRAAFQWMGDRVNEFLSYVVAGSEFIFGDLENFAFRVLPVVVYFSTFVSMMYYLGVMQVIIRNLGKFLSFCLGTAPTESISAAGNIFIGQTEAPLMIRPFLPDMTKSEMHAVMVGGFATISGAVMAAYINFGVPANHLLSASIMAAPAALALSKLTYPETEQSMATDAVYNIPRGTERNIIEAASNGASMSIKLVANIAVNLIAFVSMLDFVNATLVWLGDRAGVDGFTFQYICSYVLWPLALILGVDTEDCGKVAELLGTKTMLNEFVAFSKLRDFITNRELLESYIHNSTVLNVTGNLTGAWHETDGDIYLHDTGAWLEGGVMSYRSVVICTYALCGFANLSSLGIVLGGLGALAPERKSDMTEIVFRAMITGNVASYMGGCIAGLLFSGQE